jgi:hypothetical protein
MLDGRQQRAASERALAPIVAFRPAIAPVRGSRLAQHGLCSSYTRSDAGHLAEARKYAEQLAASDPADAAAATLLRELGPG